MKDETTMKTMTEREGQDLKEAGSPPPAQPKGHPTVLPMVALCVAISCCASLIVIYGYDRWYAQKIVAVDIKGYIARQRESYLAGKMTDDELKKSFDRLESVITAIPRNRVVIMGDAVVRNAETVNP